MRLVQAFLLLYGALVLCGLTLGSPVAGKLLERAVNRFCDEYTNELYEPQGWRERLREWQRQQVQP